MTEPAIILDASTLGEVSQPRHQGRDSAASDWLQAHLRGGRLVLLPEIADYEVRRELIRAKKLKGLRRLDQLCRQLEYLPIITPAMRVATECSAETRRAGRPTADGPRLDADMILIGQAWTFDAPAGVIVATTNLAHIRPFVAAELWHLITPR